MEDKKCYEHSTFVENVCDTKTLFKKFDEMMTRMNVVLGGIVVASVLLAINLVIK